MCWLCELGQQKIEQEGAADIVDRDRAIFDPPMFAGGAITRAADLHANDAAAEGVEQDFAISRVVA